MALAITFWWSINLTQWWKMAILHIQSIISTLQRSKEKGWTNICLLMHHDPQRHHKFFFHRPSTVIIPIYIVLHCKICNLISFCTPVFNYDPSPSVSPGDALHSLHHVQKECAVHHLACWVSEFVWTQKIASWVVHSEASNSTLDRLSIAFSSGLFSSIYFTFPAVYFHKRDELNS